MRCDDVIELFSRYRDGELAPAERRAFEAHLETCDRCREGFAALESVLAGVCDLEPEPAPPGLAAAVRARLEARTDRPRAVLLRWAMPVAAAVLLVLIAFGVFQVMPERARLAQQPALITDRYTAAGEGPTARPPSKPTEAATERGREAKPGVRVIAGPAAPSGPPGAGELSPRRAAKDEWAGAGRIAESGALGAPPPSASRTLAQKPKAAEPTRKYTVREGEPGGAPSYRAPVERPVSPAAPRSAVAPLAPTPAGPGGPGKEPASSEAAAIRSVPGRAVPEEAASDMGPAGPGRGPASVTVTAGASKHQLAFGNLTLQVNSDEAVDNAEVLLRAGRDKPEVVLWQGRLEKGPANNLDVQLAPTAPLNALQPERASTQEVARQELVIRGPHLNSQAYYVFAPSGAGSRQVAPMSRATAKPGHGKEGKRAGATWDEVLQNVASDAGVYVLAPAGFPAAQATNLPARADQRAVEKALGEMGYGLRAERGALTIEPAARPAAPPGRAGRSRR